MYDKKHFINFKFAIQDSVLTDMHITMFENI